MDAELNKRYPNSEKDNFEIWDVISNPHPYTIGNKHLLDENKAGMYLSIEMAEANGVTCAHPKCNLKYAEHEKILLVMCHKNFKTKTGKAIGELQRYLLKIKAQAEKEDYKGFAFLEATTEKKLESKHTSS